MAKKIRMTFCARVPSTIGDYMLDKEISIVDDAGCIGSMTDVAIYMLDHIEGFQRYSVEPIDEPAPEEE